jgi:thiamine-phosphate pyrophosphorylase
MRPFPRLYAIADASFGDPVEIAAQLFYAGVRLVQLRNKNASSRLLLEQTARIVSNAPNGASVVVNDRADIASLAGADGVHIGQDDLSPVEVRKIVGDAMLVGISTHIPDQVLAAMQEPVDYVAFGPIFTSSTKENASREVGLEGLARIRGLVDRPVVAIGGITLQNARDVLASGASSVAVISDLIGRGDVRARATAFLNKLDESNTV